MATAPQLPPEDTVDALVDTVRDLLRAEEARATGLNTRGSGLAGFVGLIVSVTVGLGQGALAVRLADAWRIVAIALFILALFVLVATVATTVLGVLLPQSYRSIATAEVRTYATHAVVSQPKVLVQGRVLRGLIEALATERLRNDGKAIWLRRSYKALVLGLALAAAERGYPRSTRLRDAMSDHEPKPQDAPIEPAPPALASEPPPAPASGEQSPFSMPQMDWIQKDNRPEGERR